MGLLRQEYWVTLPFPLPEEHPDPEIKPASPALACGFFMVEPLGKPPWNVGRIPNKGRNNTWIRGTISAIRQKFSCFPMWISQKPSLPSSQWEKTWTNRKSKTLPRIYQKTEVTGKTTATPNWRSRQIKGITAHQQQNVLDLGMRRKFQARLQQYMNFQTFKLVLEKAEEPVIKLPTSAGSSKKQQSSRKTSISILLTMPKPLTVWITINCGKFWKRWEYQTTWPASWEICKQVRKQQLEPDMEQQTDSK